MKPKEGDFLVDGELVDSRQFFALYKVQARRKEILSEREKQLFLHKVTGAVQARIKLKKMGYTVRRSSGHITVDEAASGSLKKDNVARKLIARIYSAEPARERIIEGHLGMVYPIAYKYLRRTIDFVDLVASGNLGLVNAADTWRGDRVISWENHAKSNIGWAIKEAVEESGHLKVRKRHDIVLLNRLRVTRQSMSDRETNDKRLIIDLTLTDDEKQDTAKWKRAYSLLDYDTMTVPIHKLEGPLEPRWEGELGLDHDPQEFGKIEQWFDNAGLTSGPRGERKALSILYGESGGGLLLDSRRCRRKTWG